MKEDGRIKARRIYRDALLLPGIQDLADSLLQELAEYKGLPKPQVRDIQTKAKELLNEGWKRRKSITDFYANSEYYLYDLSLFHSKYGTAEESISALNFAKGQGLIEVLDFGAGIGSTALIFAKHGFEVTLAEISDALLEFAMWRFKRRNLRAKFINLLREGLPADTFELCVSTDVFEHLAQPQGEIERIYPSMKDGGYLLFNIATQKADDRLMHVSTGRDILPIMSRKGFRKIPLDTDVVLCYQKLNRPEVLNLILGLYDRYIYYPVRWFLSGILEKMHIKDKVKEIMIEKESQKGAKVKRQCSIPWVLVKHIYRKLPPSLRLKISWWKFNKRLVLWRQTYKNLDFPSAINLGLSSACQAGCIYCPIKTHRWIKPVDMPLSLAQKVIDEAAEENFKGKFRWSEEGEALLNRDFFTIMEFFRARLPKNKSCLVTNMDRLDKEVAKRLLGLGLSELHLNIDGASKESYEYAKRGLSFERMKKNLLDFIDVRDEMDAPCAIHISILTAKRYLTQVEGKPSPFHDDSKEIIDYWRPLLRKSDSMRIVDFADWWAFQEKVKRPKIFPCTYFSRAVDECFIAPNGIMYPCCLDYKAQISLGNVNQNTIREIWNSHRRFEVLRMLEEGRFEELGEPCKYCLT